MSQPARLCCGRWHVGALCPDGLVMCCLCFERVAVEFLRTHEGQPENVCQRCAHEADLTAAESGRTEPVE